MSTPCLVLVHGWGFDAGIWDRLRAALGGSTAHVVDLGFFGAPVEVPWGKIPCGEVSSRKVSGTNGQGPVIAIGHSLGFQWLLRRRPVAWDGLVSISGMPRFTRGEDYPFGTPRRVLERMAARLRREPEATVADFRRRCGCEAGDCLKEIDAAKLEQGLGWLTEWDLREELAAERTPLLALAGDGDDILPWRLSESLFATREATAFHRAPGGGHALPLTEPGWCAARIGDFVKGLS